MSLHDLAYDGHRTRNGLEDYRDLTDAGVSHAEALRRIGWDEARFINVGAAAKRRGAPG